MTERLSLDRLRRIQATLDRRVVGRDPTNIASVGFAPSEPAKSKTSSKRESLLPVVAQFDVLQKKVNPKRSKRIEPIESVRLLDKRHGRFDSFDLPTAVVQIESVVPTAVCISSGNTYASSGLVIRWTRVRPLPPPPSDGDEDPRWRWGLLSVSHLFSRSVQSAQRQSARIRRVAVCGDGPDTIAGRVAVRGRIPGGPDIAVVETGLDRLWLSGFLPRINMPAITAPNESDILRWVSGGTHGDFFAATHSIRWRWQTFYPELNIAGLGRLEHIIRYETDGNSAASLTRPFGVGTSGGVLVAGGIPVGIQVAAMSNGFRVGYAQSLTASLPWLQKKLKATSIAVIHVLTSVESRSLARAKPLNKLV